MSYSILSDREIAELCSGDHPMLSDFAPSKVKKVHDLPVVSYGCSEFGYDLRLGTEFAYPDVPDDYIFDPKNNEEDSWSRITSTLPILIKGNSVMLATIYEQFDMPEDVVGIVFPKSTYSRLAITPPNAVAEPGWKGTLTIGLQNNWKYPVRLYPKEGVVQMIFFRGEKPHEIYGDGKYQNASGVTLAKT